MGTDEFSKSRSISNKRKTHIYSFGPKNTLQASKIPNVSKTEEKKGKDKNLNPDIQSNKLLKTNVIGEPGHLAEPIFLNKKRKVESGHSKKENIQENRDPNSSEVFWNYSPERDNDASFKVEETQTRSVSTPPHIIKNTNRFNVLDNADFITKNKNNTPILNKSYANILDFKNIVGKTPSSPTEVHNTASKHLKSNTKIPTSTAGNLLANSDESFEKDIDDIIDGLQSSICKDSNFDSEDQGYNLSNSIAQSPLAAHNRSQKMPRSSPLKSQPIVNEEIKFTQKYGQQVFDLLDEDDWSTSFSKECIVVKSDTGMLPVHNNYNEGKIISTDNENKNSPTKFNSNVLFQNNMTIEDDDDESLLDDIEDFMMTQKKQQNFKHPSAHIPQSITKILQRSRTFPLNKDEKVYTIKPEFMELARYSNIPGKDKKGHSYRWFKRLVILGYENLEFVDAKERKSILVCSDETGEIYEVEVHGLWRMGCQYDAGQVIHLIEFETNTYKEMLTHKKFIVDDIGKILLILNPDTLLTATVVGTSMDCMRRTVIGEKFSLPGDPSLIMLRGIIVHELFQELLLLGSSAVETSVDEILNKLISNNTKELVICGCDDIEEFKDEIMEKHVPYIKEFISKYCHENTKENIRVSGSVKKEPMFIKNIIEIEEKIWSPILGIRGVLDGHLELEGGKSVPLEIKSGKRLSNSHVAQSSLYTLLIQDRYDIACEEFLLCYVEAKDVVKHYINIVHLKHLLHYRNRLSVFLTDNLEISKSGELNNLPPVLEYGSEICERCFCNRECTVLNYFEKVQNDTNKKDNIGNNSARAIRTTDTSMIKEVLLPQEFVQSLIGKLKNKPKDFEFYKKYMNLIDLEETSVDYLNKEMFTSDSEERRMKTGKCLGNLKLEKVVKIDSKANGQFKLTFSFRELESVGANFKISEGDYIIINDEFGHFNLSSGTITSIDILKKNIVECVTKIDIRKFKSIRKLEDMRYRIDKNDIGLGMSLARYNILGLFLPEAERLKNLIVHEETPQLSKVSKEQNTDSNLDLSMIEWAKFNEDQQFAIRSALECQDYSLILGMPGTGKTTVIVEILKCLIIGNKKRVLISSYTHSAVDNILIKLEEEIGNYKNDFKILRVGNINKLHSNTKKYSPYYADTEADDSLIDDLNEDFNFRGSISDTVKSTEKMIQSIFDSNLVASTCLGIQDWVFSSSFNVADGKPKTGDENILNGRKQMFDYCILDEASQISLPIALGPLELSDKFVLVGDHFQLPPLVINDMARSKGLQISLFKKLNDYNPDSVKKLTYQYRMNEDIMKLSNELIYEGQLKCGGKNKDNKLALFIQNDENDVKSSDNDFILNWILNNEKKVTFINYDNLQDESNIELFKEYNNNEDIRNRGEMELIKNIILPNLLKVAKINDIGLMSLYRGQLNFLKNNLLLENNNQRYKDYENLEILTADQYQGRDKECIIISFVRNHNDTQTTNVSESNTKYKLLNDMERVNVAITRSKSKLIMIGSLSTLNTVANLQSFVTLLKNQNWIYDLKDSDILDFSSTFSSTIESKNKTVVSKIGRNTLRKNPILKDILAEDT